MQDSLAGKLLAQGTEPDPHQARIQEAVLMVMGESKLTPTLEHLRALSLQAVLNGMRADELEGRLEALQQTVSA